MGKQESSNHREFACSKKDPEKDLFSEVEDEIDCVPVVELMPVPEEKHHHTLLVARRTQYQEVVHQDLLTDPGGVVSLSGLSQALAEWLVILRGVAEERQEDLPPVTCRCSKAHRINEELKELARRLSEACDVVERVGQVAGRQLQDIRTDITRIAGLLRSDVSILVPCTVGRADPGVVEQARWLVAQQDVLDTVECLAKLVNGLLGVELCSSCTNCTSQAMEEEIDPEIMSMVAGMCGGVREGESDQQELGSDVNKELGKQVLEKSRKRKQARPVRNRSPSTSICGVSGTPTKRMRKVMGEGGDGPEVCLTLLERKKKLVKKDGLYKFVLWREALKDEKTKLVDF